MDWNKGYSARWRLYSVDKSTWGNGEEINGLVSSSVTKDSESALIEDASINIDNDPIKGYVRLVLEAESPTESEMTPIGTFLVTSPKRSINSTLINIDLECYSVLKPASDKLLAPGWYFPEGGDPIAGAFELLSSCLQCPIEPAESDIKTDEVKIAENNETALSMALYLLDDTDWKINISPNGEVTIKKDPEEANAMFDTYDNDVLMPDLSDESDIFDIPNVLRVKDSDGNYNTIYNNDEESETSIPNTGWEKWASEDLSLDYGESIYSKGAERMEELSKSKRKISYTREFNPNIKLNDLVLFLLPQQGIIGYFRIISQSISTGKGAKVSEIAIYEKEHWEA